MPDSFEDFEALDHKDFKKSKLAVFQNVETMPDPNMLKRIDEQGHFVSLTTVIDQQLEMSMYWASQEKRILLFIMIGLGILILLLGQYSDVFNIIWKSFLGFLGYLFSFIPFPQLPKLW